MNKKGLSISAIIVVCVVGVVFVVRLDHPKTFSVSNIEAVPVVSEELQSDDPSKEPEKVIATKQPQEASSQMVSQESAFADMDAQTIEKSIIKDSSAEEVSKVAIQKKSETHSKTVNIQSKLVSFGFSAPNKPRTIDTIVLHSSYDAIGTDSYSVSGVIAEWKDAGVAPHYLIARDGQIYRLVKDENIAYHAGVSKVPDGRTNVNDFSIGIEILNTKTDTYTDAQYISVKKLIASLKEQYAIKYILGHDDIAPDRKSDPWNFDWKKL
jgi:AmpD protein